MSAPTTSNRRGFLRHLAGLTAATPAVALPMIVSAAAIEEDPRFLEFGRRLDKAKTSFRSVSDRRAAALSEYNRRCPPVPDDLFVDDDDRQKAYRGSIERDYDGKLVGDSGRWRYVYETWWLEEAVGATTGRSKAGRVARKRLRLDKAYQAEKAALAASTSLDDLTHEQEAVMSRLKKLTDMICNTPARTIVGLQIKAKAMRLYAEAAKATGRQGDCQYWSPQLLENVLAMEVANG